MRTGWERWQGWAGSRHAAISVIVAGVILPPATTATIPGLWPPLATALGLALFAAGLVLRLAQTDRGMRRRADALASEMRALAGRIDHCVARSEMLKTDIAAFHETVAAEQRNLGMVAGGLGELRQIVRQEQQNLGLVADDVYGLKTSLHTLDEMVAAARGQAVGRLDDLAARAGAIAGRQDDLQGEIAHERHNLGMVAGALDDLRRLTASVHLFYARQAALEDTLIEIADRVDGIGSRGSRSEPLDAGAQEPEA